MHMGFGSLSIQWLAIAIQQPKIRCPFDQAKKVLGGVMGIINAQRAVLINLTQQATLKLQLHGVRADSWGWGM